MADAKERYTERPARVSFATPPDNPPGTLKLEPPHTDQSGHSHMAADAFATSSNEFVSRALMQLAGSVASGGTVSMEGLNASLALVGAIAPENELEAALAVQIATTHEVSMEMLRRTRAAGDRDGAREYGNIATKLQRTMVLQVKALSDLRRGGEQVVRHVHVYEGGQAVVAETVNVGGQNAKAVNQPHGGLPPMLCSDAARYAMPAQAVDREGTLPLPRRSSRKRRSEGKPERV